MFQLVNKSMFFAFMQLFSTEVKQELEFNIFAKTGTGFKFFGVGVESESKNSDSTHLWFEVIKIF